mmetsp:Transcript_103352/g.328671  ORF Transcript_103352/g.328671 Transcript_103352/m.328671 type:complete len:249 (-) Transcript_103352:496-1242(-)
MPVSRRQASVMGTFFRTPRIRRTTYSWPGPTATGRGGAGKFAMVSAGRGSTASSQGLNSATIPPEMSSVALSGSAFSISSRASTTAKRMPAPLYKSRPAISVNKACVLPTWMPPLGVSKGRRPFGTTAVIEGTEAAAAAASELAALGASAAPEVPLAAAEVALELFPQDIRRFLRRTGGSTPGVAAPGPPAAAARLRRRRRTLRVNPPGNSEGSCVPAAGCQPRALSDTRSAARWNSASLASGTGAYT